MERHSERIDRVHSRLSSTLVGKRQARLLVALLEGTKTRAELRRVYDDAVGGRGRSKVQRRDRRVNFGRVLQRMRLRCLIQDYRHVPTQLRSSSPIELTESGKLLARRIEDHLKRGSYQEWRNHILLEGSADWDVIADVLGEWERAYSPGA